MTEPSHTTEAEGLEARVQQLAGEKASLQLVLSLIQRLNPLASIDDLLRDFLGSIVDTIGGTNTRLYYWDAEELHYLDFLGENRIVSEIEDSLARQVQERRAFVEVEQGPDSAMMLDSPIAESCSWGFPLMVSQNLIGIVTIENLHISGRRLGKQLPAFFDHAALILSNELRRLARERTELALQQKTGELDSYFNSALDLFAIADTDGCFRKLNPSWEDALGYPIAELEGAPFLDFVHPEDLQATLDAVTTLAAEQPVVNFVNRYRHKDGSWRWIEWRSRTVGEVIHAAARDITALKQREAFEGSTREILKVLAGSGDFQDTVHRVITVLKTLTGFEAVGIRLQEGEDFPYLAQNGFPSDFLLAENSLIERRADGGLCRGPDGKPSLECTCGLILSGKADPASPLFTPGGSAWTNDALPFLDVPLSEDPRHNPRNRCIHQGYASIALVPIRARDRIVGLIQLNDRHKNRLTPALMEHLEGIAALMGEALVKRWAEAALQKVSAAVEHSSASIVITDTRGAIEFVNPKFTEVTGYTFAEALGQNPRILKSGLLSQGVYIDLWQTISAGKVWQGELHNKKKNGELYWEFVIISPIRDRGGAITGFVAVKEDITERKHMDAVRSFLLRTSSGELEEPFFHALARYLGQALDMDFVCIGHLEGDELTAQTLAVWCDGDFKDNVTYALKGTPCGDVLGNEVCCFPSGVTRLFPGDLVLQDLRAESYVGVALWGHAHRPIGLIAVIGRRPLIHRRLAEETLQMVAPHAAAELERVEAEEELVRKSNLLASTSDSLFVIDPGSRCLFDVNDTTCTQLGYSKDELQSLHLEDVDPACPIAMWPAHVEEVKATPGGLTLETWHQRKDGFRFPVEVHVRHVSLGGRGYLIASARDITERKRAAEILRAGETRFRDTLDRMSEGCMIIAFDWTYLYLNDVAAAHGLQKRENLLGRCITEMYPDLEESEIFKRYKTCMNERIPQNFESDFRFADGKTLWYRFTVYPVPEGIFVLSMDMTAFKQAEEALERAAREWSAAMDASEDVIYLMDLDHRITRANRAFYEATGTTPETALGHPNIEIIPPHEVASCPICCAQEEQRDLRLILEVDHPANPLNRPVETVLKVIRDQEGRPISLLMTLHDLSTARKEMEAKAAIERHLLQSQKLESLGSLAGGVAHDMNNVLGAILGLASANLRGQAPGTPIYRAFETISAAAERGGKMVKSLLSFARKSPVEEKELDVNALLREEVSLLERTTMAKVHLEQDLAPDLRSIRGDASALTHAFMNLCVNAVDAMPENGTITLRSRNLAEAWIEVQVQDTGSGMPPEVMEKALEPFFTTKPEGKGTGLGLSMVYGTVRAHRGEMDIQSKPGQGTIVSLRFPACSAAAEASKPAAEQETGLSERSLSVLLVDDDELIQMAIREILEMLGHRVTSALQGEEALEKLEAGLEPDVVILDMNMPGLSGGETLPRLRALRPNLPVFLATGRVDQTALDLERKHPFVRLLSKPFSLHELEVTLRGLS